MLAYTLERMLTQQAVIERDMGGLDEYGGDEPTNWQPHVTVPCRLWWARSSGARSANRVYVDPSRQVPVSEGGVIVPLGTDVTEQDRIARVEEFDQESERWETLVEGVVQIIAVLNQDGDHLELSVERTSLGA